MVVRHQFVIREASIVNRPNNLTLSIPTFIVTSHCSAPFTALHPSPLSPRFRIDGYSSGFGLHSPSADR